MCQQPEFDSKSAIAAQNREIMRLTELVAEMEARSDGGARQANEAGAPRDAAGGAGEEGDDPRVAEIVEAAPPAMRDRISRLARRIVEDGQVARGERTPRSAGQNMRVVGGLPVPAGSFLHCACVELPPWGCTGVVVAPQLVLTAAHCGGAVSRVMVGGTRVQPGLSADARLIDVRQAVVHPDYGDSENDINVLVLDAPALVPPVPLADGDEIAAAAGFDVVGFGYDDPSRPLGFGLKRRATIPYEAIMARDGEDLGELPATLGFHPEYEFVAGRKHLGIDSCNGDSGGPIYISAGGAFKLAGLTSRATRTAQVNCGDGGIYVRPDKFRQWIDQVAADAGVAPIMG